MPSTARSTLPAGAAAAGNLVTFGITPTQPETGYGYIRQGAELTGHPGVFQVDAFVEKPGSKRRRTCWPLAAFLEQRHVPVLRRQTAGEMEKFEPAIVAACREAIARRLAGSRFLPSRSEAVRPPPSISIDYAVMERTDAAVVVPVDIGWTDVGAWSALWEIGAKDEDGNVIVGDVIDRGREELLHALRRRADRRGRAGGRDRRRHRRRHAGRRPRQGAGHQAHGRAPEGGRPPRSEDPHRVHRPWGFYQCLDQGDRFQVKRLTVKPGARLSLQKHYHRAEHWVVVNGTAW